MLYEAWFGKEEEGDALHVGADVLCATCCQSSDRFFRHIFQLEGVGAVLYLHHVGETDAKEWQGSGTLHVAERLFSGKQNDIGKVIA